MNLTEGSISSKKYIQEFSTKTENYIAEFQKEVLAKIQKEGDIKDEPKIFFYTIVNKTLSTLDASQKLIATFESSPHLQTPLFILIRAMISDIIVAEFVINQTSRDEEKEKLINRIYFDHIDNIVTSLDTVKIIFDWSDDELNAHKNELKRSYHKYYENGENKFRPLKTSPRNLLKTIFCQTRRNESLELLQKAFNLYETYSKLEHLGELSFKLTHEVYSGKNTAHYTNLYDAITIITASLNNYSKLWTASNESFNLNKVIELERELRDYHPILIKNYA